MGAFVVNKIELKPLVMKNSIQAYAWGTRDEEAFIPQFLGMKAEPGKPYAELWMGAHPKASSMVSWHGGEKALHQLIGEYPGEMLGNRVSSRFGNKLPFLFKVLSIAEPLSIQAHPNKEQAVQLHAQDPVNYPDDNHKPEIAIALNRLSALMGFRPVAEIAEVLVRYASLQKIIDPEVFKELQASSEEPESTKREVVRKVFTQIMHRAEQDPVLFQSVIDDVFAAMQNNKEQWGKREELFTYCNQRYPYDIGLLSVLLLNLVELQPGQGVFINAGIPHAYLEGEIIECMANSDNVVRAGLTPKFKDVKTLTEILTYETGLPALIETDTRLDESIYETPAPEFEIRRISLKKEESHLFGQSGGPEIVLILKGRVAFTWQFDEKHQTQAFHRSHSIFIPAMLGKIDAIAVEETEIFSVRVP